MHGFVAAGKKKFSLRILNMSKSLDQALRKKRQFGLLVASRQLRAPSLDHFKQDKLQVFRNQQTAAGMP